MSSTKYKKEEKHEECQTTSVNMIQLIVKQIACCYYLGIVIVQKAGVGYDPLVRYRLLSYTDVTVTIFKNDDLFSLLAVDWLTL